MRLPKRVFTGVVSLLFVISFFAGHQNAHANGSGQGILVETAWLAENLDNPKVKVIFVDNWPSEKADYEAKHIKGSVYMGIGALMGTIGDGSSAPDQESFEGMMNRLGVNSGDHVVLYGAKGDSVFTLGALWLMEYFGHEKVSFLNGGLAKWNKENLPSEEGMKVAEPGTAKAASRNESIRVDAAYVLESLKNKNAVLVDARGHDEYIGENNSDNNKRVGHIPGALDLGYKVTNFNDDGTLKSHDALKALYESKGVTKDKEIITYCQGGIKAANAYYALKHVLGYPNVKVYVGSWSEWANRVDFEKYPIDGKVVAQ